MADKKPSKLRSWYDKGRFLESASFKPVPTFRSDGKVPGRNDPCPCDSGKKYKNCCLKKHKQMQEAARMARDEALEKEQTTGDKEGD